MMKRGLSNNRNGFTMIEVLVSLFCLSFAILLLNGAILLMARISATQELSDDRIGIEQIRFLLAQSYDIQIKDQTLFFIYRGEETRLEVHNQRLVKRKGYEIYLKYIDRFLFEKQNGCIYGEWNRNEKAKKALLVCE